MQHQSAEQVEKAAKTQKSREHHFVPRFLLRRWGVSNKLIASYRAENGEIRTRALGVGAFCKELDLLTIKAHGVAPDALEKQFFGHVDSRGALVMQKLLKDGPDNLTADERSDFTRLLLSLETRYPKTVARLRSEVAEQLREQLDNDPQILQAVADPGEVRRPSEILEEHSGTDFSSRALLMAQSLVENRSVGGRLINAIWRVYHLGPTDGTLLLADRPLFRWKGYHDPACFWMLPLTPRAIFIAANNPSTARAFDRASRQRFCKRANENTIAQVVRYIFAVDKSHDFFIEKHLQS